MIRFIITIAFVKYSIDILLKLFEITQSLLLRVNQNVDIIANVVDLSKNTTYSATAGGLAMLLIVVLIMFFIIIGSALVILGIAYSRMIMIYILLCFSPIALATFISKNSWLSSIWQNFTKNIIALSLQGLVISLIVRIIGGLFSNFAIRNDIIGVLSLSVIMVVGAFSIVKSLSFSKTLVGLN